MKADFQTAADTERRMNKLLGKLEKKAEGKRILAFARKNKIDFLFDECMRDDLYGEYRSTAGKSCIALNPEKDDAALVTNLYHELRHAEQDRAGLFLHAGWMGEDPAIWPVKNPWKFFILNRVIEADAFTRQVDLAYHHNPETRRALAKHYPELFEIYVQSYAQASENREQACQVVFLSFLDSMTTDYDKGCLNKLETMLNDYKDLSNKYPELAQILFTVTEKFDLSTDLFRRFGQQAGGMNYIQKLSDEQLKTALLLTPEIDAQLIALESKFESFFTRFSKPAPSTNKGPTP